jgi:hypothetical protein
MKLKYYNLLIILFIPKVFPSEVNAQLTVDAQYRNRFEARDGYRQITQDGSTPAVFISQRTRISLYYQADYLKIRFTPQDVRIWGDEQLATSTGVFGDRASLDLFEGYIELKAGNTGWFSVGRQQLVYDNQRLLGKRNWNQFGISYDAVVVKLQLNDWNLHIAGSWNTLLETLTDNSYPSGRIKSLNFIWLNRNLNNNLNLSFLHIASGVTQTDTTNKIYFRQTSGIYSEYKNDNLIVLGNVYYQYGKSKTGTNVSAYLICADVGYKISNLTPGIGVDYLSGNDKTGTDQKTDNLFDVLYGSRHRYFGYMDYFRNFPSHTSQGGLVDYYLYLDYKFLESLSVRNIGHYFRLAQTNPTTPENKNLGFENDLVLKYKFKDWGAFESGYCFIVPAESLKTIQGTPVEKLQQFFYLQLTITPTLFKQ